MCGATRAPYQTNGRTATSESMSSPFVRDCMLFRWSFRPGSGIIFPFRCRSISVITHHFQRSESGFHRVYSGGRWLRELESVADCWLSWVSSIIRANDVGCFPSDWTNTQNTGTLSLLNIGCGSVFKLVCRSVFNSGSRLLG